MGGFTEGRGQKMIAFVIASIALLVAIVANAKANEALRGIVTIEKEVEDRVSLQYPRAGE